MFTNQMNLFTDSLIRFATETFAA